MVASTNYTRLNDFPKVVEDWSFYTQNNECKCTSIEILAKKHAITVVGCSLNTKMFFCFNVTHVEQLKKIFRLFSEKVSIKALDHIKIWRILPYKGAYEDSWKLIDNWLAETFSGVNIENRQLEENHQLTIHLESGDETQKPKQEGFWRKVIRGAKKNYLILSVDEE